MVNGKRGQEGMSIGTLLLIILGVVVLVILILGFTMGFEYIFDKIGLLPGQSLETVAQSCAISVQGDLMVDFCSFKEVKVDGKKQYVNCNDDRLEPSIVARLVDTDKEIPTGQCVDAEKAFCEGKKADGKKMADLTVNGKTCVGYEVTDDAKAPETA